MTLYRESTVDGVRCLKYPTGAVKWRADCDSCKSYAADPPTGEGILFWPDHQAMSGCRSGGRNHCTCDGCF